MFQKPSFMLTLYEFSKPKLIFNVVSTLSAGTFGMVAVTAITLRIIFGLIGFSTFLGIPLNFLVNFAVNTALTSLWFAATHVLGQFVPPRCSNFATYLEDAGFDRNGRPVFPNGLPERPVIIVPELPYAEPPMPMDGSADEVLDQSINVDETSSSCPINEHETTVGELDKTGGSLRGSGTKRAGQCERIETNWQHVQDSEIIEPEIVETPVQRPTFEKIRAAVHDLEQHGGVI